MEVRFSAPVQTGPGAHPASCTMGTRSFAGVKSSRGVMLTPHPLLVLWSRKSRAIPLLPLWAVWPVQSLSACTKVHYTLDRNKHFQESDAANLKVKRHSSSLNVDAAGFSKMLVLILVLHSQRPKSSSDILSRNTFCSARKKVGNQRFNTANSKVHYWI